MRSWITVLQSLEISIARVLKDAASSMDTGQNLVVVKTVTGMAMAVATALDALKWPEIRWVYSREMILLYVPARHLSRQ